MISDTIPSASPATLRIVNFSPKQTEAVSAAIIVPPPSLIGNIIADGITRPASVAS